MNDNAKKWVDALRSGRYEQGTKFLGADNRYCCFGVACEVYMKENDDLACVTEYGPYRYNGHTHHIPPVVQEWLGLCYHHGLHEHKDKSRYQYGPRSLEDLNDEYGFTFKQIANVIESEPEGLFGEIQDAE